MGEANKAIGSDMNNHSSTVLQAIGNLYTKIKSGSEDDREAGLKLMWSQLGSQDSVLVCQASADLISVLVRSGSLEANSCITQLLACLSHGMEYSGILPALGQVLCHQMETLVRKHGHYPPIYSISSSQHPFISVLRSTPASWSLVLDQCLYLLDHHHGLDMLRPVLLYLFCDPNHHLHFGAMRATLLDHLLDMSSNNDQVLPFLVTMSEWIKLDNKASLQENAAYLFKLVNWCLMIKDWKNVSKVASIIPSLTFHQAKYGYSMEKSLKMLDKLLDISVSSDDDNLTIDWEAVTVVLQQVLDISPHTGHKSIVNLAIKLIPHVSRVTAGMMVATCLQSLPFPTHMPGHCSDLKADLVRLFYKTPWSSEHRSFVSVTVTDTKMMEAKETVKVISMVTRSSEMCERWLESMTTNPHNHLTRMFPLLSSLFLCHSSSTAGQLSLQLLLKCVTAEPSLSTPFLSLILHKLASDSEDAKLKLSLLHALPEMAGDKNCISLILKLVSSLGSKPCFAPLTLNLLYKLWRVESRAYPFLQKALLEPVPQTCALEYQTSQAVIIRDILRTHAVQLGSDLLPILSNILNQCSSPEGATACSIAMAGINILCKQSVIDMKTTIKVLAPKCSRDQRPMVLEAYIKLLGLAPSFKLTGSEYHNFMVDNVNWLWQTVTNSDHPKILSAGYWAIGQYPLEMTSLKMFPSQARQGLKLPARYCATPAEAARKPEDVLPYVPSECWGQLLDQFVDSQPLVSSLVKTEVINLPRAVYSLSQSMQSSGAEPVNLSHLPDHSVLRGLVQWCQESAAARRDLPRHPSQLVKENKSLVICLNILATDHSRPLPPLDWGFLEPFFGDAELRSAVISLLSRQAVTSRTAKMIVERQLRGEQSKEAVLGYIQNLDLLVNSVSQQTMSQWLVKSLQTGLHAAVSGESSAELVTMLQCLASALQSEHVGEVGRQLLAQAVEAIHDSVPVNEDTLFQEYLKTASLLPVASIERLSSPSVWWEVTPEKLFKAAGLRTHLASTDSTDTPLTWFNEILEVASKQTGDQSYLLRHLLTILTRCRRADSKHLVKSWLLELMGQISSQTRSGGPITSSVLFLLDVFSLTVIVLSETDTLVPDRDQVCITRGLRLGLMPVSISRLCRHEGNMTGQMADWCCHLYKNKNITSPYKETLADSLLVFKDAANWQEASMWGKLVVTEIKL